MQALQAEGAMNPTWVGPVDSGSLLPPLRTALALLSLPIPLDPATLLPWHAHPVVAKGGLGPFKSLRGCRGGALPR